MAANLFAPASEQGKKDVLLEIRAGMMNKDANSRMVRPDKRKGLIQLKFSEGLVHFIWKDRTTGTPAIDLMLFPDDAVFKKVEESKGRVYILEFKTSDRKLFFWMQEPKDDKDTQNCETINKYINNPPQPGQGGGNGGAPAGLGGLDLGGLDQNQLLQLLRNTQGGMGGLGALARGGRAPTGSSSSSSAPAPSSATPASGSAGTSRPPAPSATVNRQALESLLANFTQTLARGPSLGDVIDVDHLIASGLLDNPAVVNKLAEFLPSGPVTAANIKENLRSPQFQEAVSLFNQALRSGQVSGIMASFGLDASSVGPNATIEDFLLAVQKKAKEEEKKDDKMDTNQ